MHNRLVNIGDTNINGIHCHLFHHGDFLMKLSELIRARIAEKSETINNVADAGRVSRSTMAKILKGDVVPRLDTVLAIAETLGTTGSELIKNLRLRDLK